MIETLGLWIVGLVTTVFVLVGLVCATVVLWDEAADRVRRIRNRHARAQAVRRYRVPTQR
jgi:hypothetical protein